MKPWNQWHHETAKPVKPPNYMYETMKPVKPWHHETWLRDIINTEVRTVSYGPSFFRRGKRGSVTYSTDRENEVSKIFIISLFCVWGFGSDFCSRGTASKYLKQVERETNQFENVLKSLARFNTKFRVKEGFRLLLAIKVKKIWW